MSPPIEILIYTRPGCRLCDEAEAAIDDLITRQGTRHRTVKRVNVETDPELEAAYGHEIPVVSLNGGPAFPYRRGTGRLERELERLWKP